MQAIELPPEVVPLAFLIGTWRGEGRGEYPTIHDFAYTEQVEFGTIPGKPFLTYGQKTNGVDGRPLHTEAGYVRPVPGGVAELVIAQPTGVTEIHAGPIRGTTIEFETLDVGLSPTAKDVRAVRRSIRVVGDILSYTLDMAAVGHDLRFHLEATLHKVE